VDERKVSVDELVRDPDETEGAGDDGETDPAREPKAAGRIKKKARET
jgi:hypothetical protein